MGIGIQNNRRPPLPGTSDIVAPGRGPSEARLENQPAPETVEIPTAAAAADPPVIVRLNFSGAAALNQGLLAGAQPLAEANAFGQAHPAPQARGRGASAAATEASKDGAWTTQSLRAAGLMGLALGSELLDTGFIGATREFAAALLTAAHAKPAQVAALEGRAPGGEGDLGPSHG